VKEKKFIRSNPHLPVRNLQQTLDYYKNVLGFRDEWTWSDREGKIADGGISRDDMRLLFAEDPDFTNAINSKTNRLPLMWFVENIDDVFAEFQNRNIEIIDGLRTHSYGLREFSFVDINGYYIRVAEKGDDL
jgi:uncharacterized glyoxalase superfamily protein PhnB